MSGKFITFLFFTACIPNLGSAGCLIKIAGTACHSVPKSFTQRPGPVEVGETIERGAYSVLMNPRYYGLPAVTDGWVYMRIEDEIYRVEWRSHRVLERVTHRASSNF